MYTPQHFKSAAPWQEMLRRHAFGLLITSSGDELWTTHLPYLLADDGETVRMHMARANPHWQAIEQQPLCRFVVQGEHGYISPDWYDTPESVPTWNYGRSCRRQRSAVVRRGHAVAAAPSNGGSIRGTGRVAGRSLVRGVLQTQAEEHRRRHASRRTRRGEAEALAEPVRGRAPARRWETG